MNTSTRALVYTLVCLSALMAFPFVPVAGKADNRLPANDLGAPEAAGNRSTTRASRRAPDDTDTSKKKKKRGRKKKKKKKRKKLTFRRVLELNSAQIFGGATKFIDKDTIEITFDRAGQFVAGFTGGGMHDDTSPAMVGANRRFIMKEDKVYPGLCVCGLGQGFWQSRFPLKGATWIKVGFRIPNFIGPESQFTAITNWNPKVKAGFATSFFHRVSVLVRGTPRESRLTPHREYQKPARDWFPRHGESVPCEYGFRDDEFIVSTKIDKTLEMVKLSRRKDRGGYVAFSFSKLVFTFDNLVIRGTLDREWCESELRRLKKEGKLITKEPKPPSPEEPKSEGDAKNRAERRDPLE